MKSILTMALGFLLITSAVLALTTSNAVSFSKGSPAPGHISVIPVNNSQSNPSTMNVNPVKGGISGMVAASSSRGVGRHSHQRVSRAFRELNLNGIGTVDSSLPSPRPTETESQSGWRAEYSGIPSRP